jgi:hypothetical protein
MTPSDVYIGDCGFFLTPIIGRQNVAFNCSYKEDGLSYARSCYGLKSAALQTQCDGKMTEYTLEYFVSASSSGTISKMVTQGIFARIPLLSAGRECHQNTSC